MSKTTNIKATLMLLTLSTFTTEATARGLRDIGDSLQVMIPAYALGLAVKEDTDEGVSELWQSVLTTQLATEVLKKATKQKRPDYEEGDKKDSFPSGHSAGAFSGATFIHKRYGLKQAVIPYTLATVVAYSRVDAKRHHPRDVIAGAGLAGLSTWIFVDSENKLSLTSTGDETILQYKTKF